MEQYICVHGHFYQPSRENPWLETVELQDSADPYHDWNERITAECYAPNATSRILDEKRRIVQIINNYARMSFDFGPTLLAWMKKSAPHVYGAIVEADQESQNHFSGHGSALAQAYHHAILPLANRRDKVTQILWGLRDFEHHFGRKPEGMWLPEAAVDLETLDILAEQGIRFTILAPHQAHRIRILGEKTWQDVRGGRVDPTMPYEQFLPSGRSVALFFYDGPISRAVAFEKLLHSGQALVQRLTSAFSGQRTWPQIVHIATDGESYGHHHRHGEMALAYALDYIESNKLARLTNYGEYLGKHLPTHEVEIFENSSWSCVHGIERWRGDCGCNIGGRPGWNQVWRKPLREALDWLRNTLVDEYEKKARWLIKNPWKARDNYIDIVSDRSPEAIEGFLSSHAKRPMKPDETVQVLKLMELQRHAMLMYTSCGWFFDELSGIETVQIIQYAARAIQLAEDVFGNSLEAPFLKRLEEAKSNIAEYQDGRVIYGKFVKPAMVDLEQVGAHYAMSSLFNDYTDQTQISCYRIDQERYETVTAEKAKLAVGRIKVTSEITLDCDSICFGVLHWGDYHMGVNVRRCREDEPDETFLIDLLETFSTADFPETMRHIEQYFEGTTYALINLFRDAQRKIIDTILESAIENIEAVYRQVYENNIPLLRFLKNFRIPRPQVLRAAADSFFNISLRRAFEKKDLDLEAIKELIDVGWLEGAAFDEITLEMAIRRKFEELAARLSEDPDDLSLLQNLEATVSLLQLLPFEVNTRNVQNQYYAILQNVYPKFRERENRGDETAKEWAILFRELGKRLWVRVG